MHCGDARNGNDLDFLFIEREVDDRTVESVRLRRAARRRCFGGRDCGGQGAWAALCEGSRGTIVERALREGCVVAQHIAYGRTLSAESSVGLER